MLQQKVSKILEKQFSLSKLVFVCFYCSYYILSPKENIVIQEKHTAEKIDKIKIKPEKQISSLYREK